jgi:hypothetical protein
LTAFKIVESRKVTSGKVSPIVRYVGGPRTMPVVTPNLPTAFNLYGLITAIGEGISRWGEANNADREKLLTFIESHDTTIAASRMASFAYPARGRMNGRFGVPRAAPPMSWMVKVFVSFTASGKFHHLGHIPVYG